MKKLAALLLALLLLLTSCAAKTQDPPAAAGDPAEEPTGETTGQSAFPYSFKDATGTTVTLDKRPETVAVLFSSFADIWVTAGGAVSVSVGESVERGFADSGAILVDSGAGHSTIDLETLLASSPDLVIGTADYACQTQAVEICRAAGIPAALFRVECFADYLNVLGIFCRITGNTERYRTYGTAVKEEIELLFARVSELRGEAPAPRVLFVRAGSSAKSTKAKTAADHFACVMLDELGAVNIADAENGLTGTLSLEVIVQEDPDYLLITTMGDETAAKDYMNAQLCADGWRELSCVTSGRYDYLPKDLFHFKPNARWAQAYLYLAQILYPELSL